MNHSEPHQPPRDNSGSETLLRIDAAERRDDRLQLAFNSAQMGWWHWNLIADQITWSDKPEKIVNISHELGSTLGEFLQKVHPDDREQFKRALHRTIDADSPFEIELRLILPDDSCRWYFAKGQVYRDAEGRAVRMAGIDMDITGRKRNDDALRQSEAESRAIAAELATVIKTVPALMFLAHDPECRVISSNDTGFELLRLPKGASALKAVATGEKPATYRVLQDGRELMAHEMPVQKAAATGREVRDVEVTLEFDDGVSRDIFGHAAPLFDNAGNVRGAVGAFVDITERKLAESRFEALLQTAPDAIVIVDEQGQIVLVNTQVERQFGYVRDEMLGRPVEMLIPNRLRPRHRIHRADYFANPYVREMGSGLELSGRRKDGSEFPVEIRLGLLRTNNSLLVSSAIRDVSDRKRVEREAAHRLRQLERLTTAGATILDVFESTADDAMYAAVLEVVLESFDSRSGCFVRFDDDGSLTGPWIAPARKGHAQWSPDQWNPLWRAALDDPGVVASEVPCRVAADLDVQRSLVTTILDQGRPLGLLHIGDAESIYCDADSDLLERVARLIGPVFGARVQRDREARERKKAEAQLENYRAELAHALRLNTMAEMAAGIAHELNQPLSAISNFAHGTVRRLQNGVGEKEELIAVSKSIADEAGRAAEIIRSLRRFVQRRKPQQTSTDINDIVHGAARIVAGQAHQRGVTIHVQCAANLPPIEGDQIQLKQVVVNLLSNGLDALESRVGEKSLLIETTRCSPNELDVSVADNGLGLNAADEQKIFEAFFTTKPDGLGMGLAISRSMIEAHGGRLWAETNVQGGATFRFRLPVESHALDRD